MPATKLTKTIVDKLEARSKPWIMYDQEVKGFGVRVGRNGGKAWIVEYRPCGGGRGVSTKRLKLGDTTILTIDEARKAARTVLAKARLGEDLADRREQDRAMPTVEELSRDFMSKHMKAKRKGSTCKTYSDHLRRFINPVVGSTKVHMLTTEMVSELHLKVGRENGKGIANRMLITLSSMYGWAAKQKRFKGITNPVSAVERYPENYLERYLTSAEIGALGDALVEAETIGIPWEIDDSKPTAKHLPKENRRSLLSPHVAGAFRLLLLTGCRTSEILGLRWDEVDLERGVLFLPDSKTGKKIVILSSHAAMVLSDLPKVGEYVIAGKFMDKPRHQIRTLWGKILRMAGIARCRVHDLRHTNASIGIGNGVSLTVVGKLLGHRSPETTKRYAHLADDPARRATEAIGLNVFQALTGKSVEEKAQRAA